MSGLPPLSLYVHLPWCVSKCPYCDFNSFAAGSRMQRERYLDALVADAGREAEAVAGRELVSVFLGGGTPSLFSPREIARLLAAIGARFAVRPDAEITMEANPGTVESADPGGYREAGVNRLSIGAQSFSADSLARLGRIHGADDTRRMLERARSGGFDNINVDLMFALPGQTPADAVADIDAAIELAPEHISWYQLTLEPNTVFHARPPAGLPDDDVAAGIGDAGRQRLAAAGYVSYEVSAYARNGRRCRHNLNYWTYGDYAAIGAGAYGKLTSTDGVRRYHKPANPGSYMHAIERGAPVVTSDVDAADRVFEFMLGVLRLADGFDEALFAARTGLDPLRLAEAAAGAVERGLIERDPGARWRPTDLGRRFLNDLQAAFLP
jgi:oxygen-independent coproporphyrinogen-3 oxidase